jgi:hypothetical protein
MARFPLLLIAATLAASAAFPLRPAGAAETTQGTPDPASTGQEERPNPDRPFLPRPPGSPGPRAGHPPKDRPWGPGSGKPREALQERIKQVPPERREHLLRNMERWEKLPPEEQAQMRRAFEERRRRMVQEAERAMRELGIDPQGPRREAFLGRYAEERRALEDDLRRRMEEDRAARLPKLLEKLRAEFAPDAAGEASSAASP